MTEVVQLPQRVIEEDHRLESTADRANATLMEHRWHWTLDESNPERVSVLTYAKAIGKDENTIRRYARAYELRSQVPLHEEEPPVGELLHRAQASAEQQTVVDAVATARGLNYATVAQTYGNEVRHVRTLARERAEERGTTVEEEAPKLAQMIVKAERAEQITTDERRERHDFRYFELDGYLASALRYLARAEKLAGTISWDDEERELLAHVIDQIRRLCGRIDQRIAGVKEIDWDSELEAILAKSGG